MNNVEPTDIKLIERKWALPLSIAALSASYPLLFFLVNKQFLLFFFLFGSPSALGISVVWLTIKRLNIDEISILKKYHLHPQTLACGTGGPLAGLVFLFTICRHSTCMRYDSCEYFLGFMIVMLPLFGQIFWLIWPLAAVRTICHNHVKIVKKCGIAEDIIIICGLAALLPGFGFIFYFLLYAGIGSLAC